MQSGIQEQAQFSAAAFGEEWLKAWKNRDLEAILAHYADDVELRSPLAVRVLGEPSGVVKGKRNLQEYLAKVLALIPREVTPELVGVFEGVSSLIVHFKSTAGTAAELMELSAEGKVRRAVAHFQS